MNKLKKFLKELPTVFKLKKQIKNLKNENQIKEEKIEDLEEQIKDISDTELMGAKIDRLETSNRHWLRIVHELREDNKKLRKELEEAKKCCMK